MAKVKRSVLKQLIKECLVEILVEGISADSNSANALVEALQSPQPSSIPNRYESELTRLKSKREKLDNVRVDNPINENMIKSLTEDSVMADIFRDTAQTTLMEQGTANKLGDSRPVSNDVHAQVVAENELEDLFENTDNWAALAFANKGK